MKRLMLIGRTGCGKTTLTQALLGQELRCRKTQAVDYRPAVIDTPGEYLENRRFYSALRATAADCALIALVQDAGDSQSMFPPQFAGMFAQPVIGIVTKIETAAADCGRAEKILHQAGAAEIIRTSAFERLGLEHLQQLGYGSAGLDVRARRS